MTPNNRLGLALILTAPSGAGKSTLIRKLQAEFPGIGFSVSCTTRQPRPGERPGEDYVFLDVETFRELIDKDHFAEWALVHGNYYGTPKEAVRSMLAQGRDVIFDIDVQGARALKTNLNLGRSVFILPPSRQELYKRLAGRGSETPETLARRMNAARAEIEQAPLFDHVIVNAGLDTAYDELRAVYIAERSTLALHPGLLESLLTGWEGQPG